MTAGQNKAQHSGQINSALTDNTYWDTIRIGGQTFYLKRVRDPEKVLNVITDHVFLKDEYLPYWTDLWPSAIALAEYIVENREEFRFKTALEIGCGLGLSGIAASSVGVTVTFSDYDSWALQFAEESYMRNFQRRASVQLMDWRKPASGSKFDLILAADILYEKRWLSPVLEVIEVNMKKQGIALIAEPNRPIAKDFFSLLRKRGWQVRSLLKHVIVCDKLHQVTINRITKC